MQLLNNDGTSDTGVTEAPSLVKSDSGEYVLFFSRNCYSSINYTVSYATADNVAGPYTRRGDLLLGGDNSAGLAGTGGSDVLWDGVHMGEFLVIIAEMHAVHEVCGMVLIDLLHSVPR